MEKVKLFSRKHCNVKLWKEVKSTKHNMKISQEAAVSCGCQVCLY